jgi:glycerol-1-phosphate dehydrogenase [NAD(P)+]
MPSMLSDPTDLDGLRQQLAIMDADSRLSPLDMMRLVISDDAHLKVKGFVDEALASVGKTGRASLVILTDSTLIMRDGQGLRSLVEDQLADDFALRVEILKDGHTKLHADEAVLDMASVAVAGADAIITIGSGTMTDVGKVASQRNGGIPHIVVQTAASVDGFTDNVSVVLKSGVKRTIPSRWPTIVLADAVTIAEAPLELNTSGFGEAISLFTAPADWYLANLLGLDGTFHPASMTLLKAAAAEPPDWSSGIASGDPAAIQALTRLLALRGIVSGISNTTACLSGVEHVISHMLDLHHAANHQPIGLHGAQVGVASLVASRIWRHAIDVDLIRPELLKKPYPDRMRRRISDAFGHLGHDGAIAAECWRDCQTKLAQLETNWARVVSVVANWKQHCVEFGTMVQPSETLRQALRASGSPATFASLNPSISPELARWAVANCHLMRNRFNLVDFLDMLGLWTDEMIDWAMAGMLTE